MSCNDLRAHANEDDTEIWSLTGVRSNNKGTNPQIRDVQAELHQSRRRFQVFADWGTIRVENASEKYTWMTVHSDLGTASAHIIDHVPQSVQ